MRPCPRLFEVTISEVNLPQLGSNLWEPLEGTDADETLIAGIQKSITTTEMSRLEAGKALEEV